MTVINTNVNAVLAQNSLVKNERAMSSAMEQLSTGKRINSAADDAAGMAIASKMTAQIRGLDQAGRNINDAVAMIQTAEGATGEITNMLQRMRELAVQASSGTYTTEDKANIELEFQALLVGIDNIADTTQWNGGNILDGTGSATTFQIGANDSQTLSVDLGNLNIDGYVAGVAGVNTITTSDTIANLTTSVTVGDVTVDTSAATTTATLAGVLNADTDFAKSYFASGSTTTLTITEKAGSFSSTGPTTAMTVSSGTAPTYSLAGGTASVLGLGGDISALTSTSTGSAGFSTLVTSDADSGNVTSLTVGSVTVSGITGNTTTAGLVTTLNANTDFAAKYTATTTGVTNLVITEKAGSFTNTGPQVFTAGVFTTAPVATTTAGSLSVLDTLDAALAAVSTQNATNGAAINQLEYTADSLANVSLNTQASRSRIEDADYAKATTELARTQIIQQAGTAMLAQANQQSQGVLALLQ